MAESDIVRSDSQQKIIDYLDLQDNPNKDEILADLLTQGRRSFCNKHKKTSLATILSKVNHADFLELMKQDIRDTWEMRLFATGEESFETFYNTIKEESENQLDATLTRVAENGNAHMKSSSSQILYIIVELTFPDMANDMNVIKNLWIYLTTDGLRCLNNFSNYIPQDTLTELLDENISSPLYLALTRYYKDELKELLEQNFTQISIKNLCDFRTLHSFAREGWLEGIKYLSSKIAPRRYKPLERAITEMVQKQKSQIIAITPDVSSASAIPRPPLFAAAPSDSTSIAQRISDHLQLDDDPKKDEIISALLKNGRQALFQYQDDLIPELFSIERNYVQGQPDTPLLKILRQHVREILKFASEQTCPTLFPLIQRANNENNLQFMIVERRFAENYVPYTKASFVLFFVLQYLFDGVDDSNENTTNLFKQLFERVIRDGIQGTKGFEQYIAKNELNEQINNNQSLLFSVLRIYFDNELQKLLAGHNIPLTKDLSNFMVENIIRDGWINTIESPSIKDKMSFTRYEKLREIILKAHELGAVEISDRLSVGTTMVRLSYEQLQSKLEQLKAENKLLNNRCNQLEKENQTLVEDNIIRRNEVQHLKDTILQQTEKTYELEKHSQHLENEMKQLNQEIERLNRAMTTSSNKSKASIIVPSEKQTTSTSRPALTTTQVQSESKVEYINILLLGESGVGKSTFINALANYLHFDSFETAKTGKLIAPIPVSFLMTISPDFEERQIKFGEVDTNENHKDIFQSVTQQCRSYLFKIGSGKTLRIIDTPSFSDTRGNNQNQTNLNTIFSFVNNLTHLNAVCVFLKPNLTRITPFFQLCFTEIFEYFGERIRDHLIFCFTNARTTFFAPGEFGPILKSFLETFSVKQIPFRKSNTFCFDSESFRYLVAIRNGWMFDEIEEADFRKSWDQSVKESRRLQASLCNEFHPYRRIMEWQSKKDIQYQINLMIRPILEGLRNILRNLVLFDKNHSIMLKATHVNCPNWICYSCNRIPKRFGDFWIYRDLIHNSSNQCIPHGLSPTQYTLDYESCVGRTRESRDSLEQQQMFLCDACAQLTKFLQLIGTQDDDPFHLGLMRMWNEETDLGEQHKERGCNQELKTTLQACLQIYEASFEQTYLDTNEQLLPKMYEMIQSVSKIPVIYEQLRAIQKYQQLILTSHEHVLHI